MGLFKKEKINKVQFSDYNSKSKQSKRPGSILTSFDRLQFLTVPNNSQEELLDICNTIISGKAILANFDQLSSDDANYMLAFISGVVYATDGQIFKLDTKLFLFGRKEEFEDGSLLQYVEDTR